jgi:WD40 repeat protein
MQKKFEGDIYDIKFSADNKSIFINQFTRVKVYDVESGKLMKSIEINYTVKSFCFSKDESLILIAASPENIGIMMDLMTGKCIKKFRDHEFGGVNFILISSTKKEVFTCSGDRTIKRFDSMSGRCISTFIGHDNAVNSMLLTLDDITLISGSSDSTIRYWDVATGKCIKILGDHEGYIKSMEWLNESLFASTSGDNSISYGTL